MMNPKLLINPFERIAGVQALVIGFVSIGLAGTLAGHNGAHFPDLIKTLYTVSNGPFVPVAEIGAAAIALFLLSSVMAFIFKANFRIIDLLGTVSLSRAPYVLLALGGYLGATGMPYELWQAIVLPLIIICLAWSMILLYHAIRISANLKGKHLWITFAVTTISTELLMLLFMKKIYLIIL
ncbi:hypothetical protein [Reichenbachiella ulvae]|uniref:Yip1 domain-containing protein n=1 Tax=Reichenbachiella ulvae TaxID=2980104 RepID=A0ABT3CW18_9BACT|nr:hypothetical protein [Reichenbachiella ulvae]MCV9387739.1 hypothetical protein [Reichenbachiella ulvae]